MVAFTATLRVCALAGAALALPAVKRQAGPLVYTQGENAQNGAVATSSAYTATPIGCYSDNYPYTRVLNGSYFFEPTYTTPETCAKYCAGLGYLFSGTEYYTQCFCGNGLDGATLLDPSECSAACQADPSQTCGGENTLSVQSLSYAYQEGCFDDDVNYRSLTGSSYTSSEMTVESCSNFCAAAGFSLAGLEYADECYCGNALRLGPSTNCNMQCSGNAGEICGGGDALSVYTVTGQSIQSSSSASSASLGCFEDYYPDHRVLSGPSIVTGDLTNEACQSYCVAQGYPYSGTEYADECYCGMQAPETSSMGCTTACAGDASEICGGSNAISVLYYGSAMPSASSSQSSASAPVPWSNATYVAPVRK